MRGLHSCKQIFKKGGVYTLEVTLVGCGATMPLPGRATAVGAVKYNGRIVLFDCGEGTQVAARMAGVSLVRIDVICFTHYHGDHIFGLPGLLQTMASQGRTEPVYLIGPDKGYDETVGLLLALTGQLPFEIIRKPLAQERFDLWDGLYLESFPLCHRVPCNGYRLQLPRSGRFLPQKAKELCVAQTLWGVLQKGVPVLNQNGETILPQQVLGPARTGLSVVYATDTAPCKQLVQYAQNADLLICDATYANEEDLDKAKLYGHSTFAQCGELAAKAKVKRLWLTHFGGALTNPKEQLSEAQAYYPTAEAGFDGKTIQLNFSRE